MSPGLPANCINSPYLYFKVTIWIDIEFILEISIGSAILDLIYDTAPNPGWFKYVAKNNVSQNILSLANCYIV